MLRLRRTPSSSSCCLFLLLAASVTVRADEDNNLYDNGEETTPQKTSTCLLDGHDLYVWTTASTTASSSSMALQARKQSQPWMGDFVDHTIVELSAHGPFPLALNSEQQEQLWGNSTVGDEITVEVRFVLPEITGNSSTISDTTQDDDDDDDAAGMWFTCLPHRYIAPIALDLDSSGAVERTTVEQLLPFDMSGNGQLVSLHHWIAPTEGILINAELAGYEGIITARHFRAAQAQLRVAGDARRKRRSLQKWYHPDEITGKYLYGDMDGLFRDGFFKLASMKDTDRNGIVEGEELVGLAVWRDRNSNGRVEVGEVDTLASYGIVALETDVKEENDRAVYAHLEDGSKMLFSDRGGLL